MGSGNASYQSLYYSNTLNLKQYITFNSFRIIKSKSKGRRKNTESTIEICTDQSEKNQTISLSNKEAATYCMPNIKPIQGSKKSKEQISESTNSTINHSSKITASNSDGSRSWFGNSGKRYYGKVASQPKCKHIIITARSTTNRPDKFAGRDTFIPLETISIHKKRRKSIDVIPLTSRAYSKNLSHPQGIESIIFTIRSASISNRKVIDEEKGEKVEKVEILPNIAGMKGNMIGEQGKIVKNTILTKLTQ